MNPTTVLIISIGLLLAIGLAAMILLVGGFWYFSRRMTRTTATFQKDISGQLDDQLAKSADLLKRQDEVLTRVERLVDKLERRFLD